MEDYAILIILFLMAVCLLILTVIGYWGVFCKAGEKGWKVLIPFYNEYLLFKIAWKPSICLSFTFPAGPHALLSLSTGLPGPAGAL